MGFLRVHAEEEVNAYRILADENVERATVNYLRKLGHEVDVSTTSLNSGRVPTTDRSPGTPVNTTG